VRSLVEKSADADLLREMIGFAAERLMELEVGSATGADFGEKNPMRLAQRNGYRDRDWETRAGTVELRIPKLRKGSDWHEFWSISRIRGDKGIETDERSSNFDVGLDGHYPDSWYCPKCGLTLLFKVPEVIDL
jgi:hypothetical protein